MKSSSAHDPSGLPRVAVVYHYFQHYRAAVFEALIDSDRYEYVFVADTRNMYDSGVEPWPVPESSEFHEARCCLLPGGFMWQRGVVSLAFRDDLDAIIFLWQRILPGHLGRGMVGETPRQAGAVLDPRLAAARTRSERVG